MKETTRLKRLHVKYWTGKGLSPEEAREYRALILSVCGNEKPNPCIEIGGARD